MKSYIDLEQSKRLAEILPLESADMCYIQDLLAGGKYGDYKPYIGNLIPAYGQDKIKCWSLTALLEFLRNSHDCNYVTLTSNKASLWCLRASYYNHVWEDAEEVSEDAVDACVKMIIKLNELKML